MFWIQKRIGVGLKESAHIRKEDECGCPRYTIPWVFMKKGRSNFSVKEEVRCLG